MQMTRASNYLRRHRELKKVIFEIKKQDWCVGSMELENLERVARTRNLFFSIPDVRKELNCFFGVGCYERVYLHSYY